MMCPSCKLENPLSAMMCDCGYRFVPGSEISNGGLTAHAVPLQVDPGSLYLRSIAASVDSIRKMILFWIVASIAAGVVWGLIVVYQGAKQQEIMKTLQDREPERPRR